MGGHTQLPESASTCHKWRTGRLKLTALLAFWNENCWWELSMKKCYIKHITNIIITLLTAMLLTTTSCLAGDLFKDDSNSYIDHIVSTIPDESYYSVGDGNVHYHMSKTNYPDRDQELITYLESLPHSPNKIVNKQIAIFNTNKSYNDFLEKENLRPLRLNESNRYCDIINIIDPKNNRYAAIALVSRDVKYSTFLECKNSVMSKFLSISINGIEFDKESDKTNFIINISKLIYRCFDQITNSVNESCINQINNKFLKK
ncbi:hypothetical protein [Roseibium sp. RKSG952]|uniref:hypothetical protein n=1 Tax=Roseibium sp. RKSG952 TaxID=2529384 RepID=UPI0012BCE8B4|nr:hypothetical protein [Roseibium sp. RKSG952]MTH97682.1 hypothetical protein [Roseibium sp. RKSG952]